MSLKVSGLSWVRNRRAGNDVRNVRLWRGLLGVDKRTVIEDIEFDEEGADGAAVVVARVRPGRGAVAAGAGKAPWYDRGEGRRRWRGLDCEPCRWCWRPMRRG